MTIPPLAEAQEKPLKIAPEEQVVLQPKFDGCQAIFIPSTNGYHAFTRKGQSITRLGDTCLRLDAAGLAKVYFAEYMPLLWTEDGKHKLAGNLYSTDPLPFQTKLQVFDCIDPLSFTQGLMKSSPCKPRLIALDADKARLATAGIDVSPWADMSYAEAKALCKTARIETPEGTRCLILGELVEGGIIRAGNRIEKDKAKVDVDICVLRAVVSDKGGQRGWIAVDTKRPTAAGLMIVYGGVTPLNHTRFGGKVVEVDMLTVSGVEGGGNPTFRRDRSNEKEFDHASFKREFTAELNTFERQYAVRDVAAVVEL